MRSFCTYTFASAALLLVVSIAGQSLAERDRERSGLAPDNRSAIESVSDGVERAQASSRRSLSPPADDAPRPRLYTGRVRVHDRHGNIADDAAGFIELAGRPPTEWIAFQAGVLHAEALPGTTHTLSGAQVGRLVAATRTAAITFDGSELLVELDLTYEGAVRVVDASSGSDLDAVIVTMARSFGDSRFAYPAQALRASALVRDEGSPITMPRSEGVNTYWARAAGYAWQRFSFLGTEVDEVVELVPGGSLDAGVLGAAPRAGSLRLSIETAAGAAVVHERLEPGARSVLEGMQPGAYRASVQESIASGPWRALTSSEITVEAGERTRLDLDLTGLQGEERFADVDLLVRFEQLVARAGERSLELERLDGDGRAVPGEGARIALDQLEVLTPDSLFAWRLRGLSPGRWRFTVTPDGVAQELELAAGARESARIDVRPVAQLTLYGIDLSDGSCVAIDRVFWRVAGSERWNVLTSSDVGSAWSFNLPSGDVEISARANGYAPIKVPFRTLSGPNDLTLDFEPVVAAQFALAFVESDKELAITPDYWPKIVIDGPGQLLGLTLSGPGGATAGTSMELSRAVLTVSQPGSYVLSFPELEGYAAIDAAQVVAKVEAPTMERIPVRVLH
ncbi:MAG: hypothetical protein GY711_11070 [bacterium]|nr:hypothetical protein [bacterium]